MIMIYRKCIQMYPKILSLMSVEIDNETEWSSNLRFKFNCNDNFQRILE